MGLSKYQRHNVLLKMTNLPFVFSELRTGQITNIIHVSSIDLLGNMIVLIIDSWLSWVIKSAGASMIHQYIVGKGNECGDSDDSKNQADLNVNNWADPISIMLYTYIAKWVFMLPMTG